MENVIELKDIHFKYRNSSYIFKGFNLSLRKGERLGIYGPNGSGKTTLLYIIMGLLQPESGKIVIFGKERKGEKNFIEVRRRIGLLFQNSDDQIFCPSVFEEVAFGPINLGFSEEEVKIRVKNALKKTGLSGFENRIPFHLSEGEKKRVALASILSMEPEVLLLDEPTNMLDSESLERIREIIVDYETGIIVSQDIHLLEEVCHRILKLH